MRSGLTIDGGEGGGVDPGLTLLCVALGNTRARLGLFRGAELVRSIPVGSPVDGGGGDPDPGPDAAAAFGDAVREAATDAADLAGVVVASVHRGATARSAEILSEALPGVGVYRVGKDLPIDLDMRVEEPGSVGEDRLMNAVGAFSRTKQATLVIDAGTAVTIDFVDGVGAFCGGAIVPGVRMMMRALAAGTDALPDAPFELRGEGEPPFAGSTVAAMRAGSAAAVRGALRECLDRYSEAFGAYPQVVATGGDLGVLEATGLVEHAIPDLQLIGIQVCASRALSGGDGEREG